MRRKGTSERRLIILILVTALISLSLSMTFGADAVRVGALTDLSGNYAGISGSNRHAIQMAIDDFGGELLGRKIELVVRDGQAKADVSNQKAKEMYEKDEVDIIIGVPNSGAALAVAHQADQHKKLFFSVGSGTTRNTGPDCNRYTFDWGYNDYMLATAGGLWAINNLGKKWYFIAADYEWGHDLLKHFKAVVLKNGGASVGEDLVALGTSDFSPYILKALQAKPDVVALLNAGKDGLNSTKAATEFGLKKNAKIVHPVFFIDSIKAVGPQIYAGDYATAPWYWKSENPGSKEFVANWIKKFSKPPHWMNATSYTCTLEYLKAVQRAGTKEPDAVIRQLEGLEFTGVLANPGFIRPEDHMVVQNALIVRAKEPEEIKEAWDFFEIVGVIPAAEAFMDPKDTGCDMN